MKLDLSSLSFNLTIETGGGTPAWGTALGQGEGYKFAEGLQDLLTAMLYKSIPDLNSVTCPLGKGGQQRENYDFILASVFDKVYVNGDLVDNAKMLLLIVRQIKGDYHIGRCTLKYNPKMTYHDKLINEECYKLVARKLGVDERNGAWFIDDIDTINQDELHLTAYVGGNNPISFTSNSERKEFYFKKIGGSDYSKRKLDRGSKCEDLSFHQVIYYGAPGTGKSYKIKHYLENRNIAAENIFRTTFHPDSDYSTFVGAYKPTMVKQYRYTDAGVRTKYYEDDDLTNAKKSDPIVDKSVEYNFVPQAFLNAYVRAYQTEENVYLIIEEINRGNCAQIFGDLFQLLDRNAEGKSIYSIKADADIKDYLEEKLGYGSNGIENGELCLPQNLYILATMNTSDQSLFPIDSAFKRRWDWEYEPIKYKNKDWKVVVGDKEYYWVSFQKEINDRIFESTHSEDKMLGDYFVNPQDGIICEQLLLNKVLFYLWNDVCKDGEGDIFKTSETEEVTFSELYGESGQQKIIQMMEFLKVEPVSKSEDEDETQSLKEELEEEIKTE